MPQFTAKGVLGLSQAATYALFGTSNSTSGSLVFGHLPDIQAVQKMSEKKFFWHIVGRF